MNDASTDRYAVIGYPVQHSWSPFIHGLFAKQTGQRMSYSRMEVAAGKLRARCRRRSSPPAAKG